MDNTIKIDKTEEKLEHHQEIRVEGLVQGVGFRPTVWRYANDLNIRGKVINDGAGVLIKVLATKHQVNELLNKLLQKPPPLANIITIKRTLVDCQDHYENFEILTSISDGAKTDVSADAATCSECIKDITNTENRRFKYSFTNCTHCGPRISIIKDIPYDRGSTSMKEFVQCEVCLSEYQEPSNRRFHAQPNACSDCGPSLWICDPKGQTIETEDCIDTIIQLLRNGKIIALKGIGGFQLVCDASSKKTIELLRSRKIRPMKPFALMAKNNKEIQKYCHVSEIEMKLLNSPQAPIVLLEKNDAFAQLPNSVAPNQNLLGFMLPYSPLHHLIISQLKAPLVVTSANISNKPPCIGNQQALKQLNKIVDFFVLNNRDIVNRLDDSVVRVINKKTIMIRRARGYAPNPIILPDGFSSITGVMACGAELKNTFCLIKDGKAIQSPHIGNLENNSSYEDYLSCVDLHKKLFQFEAKYIAVDTHPEYLSSKYGRALSEEEAKPLYEIQHHHAHIAACLAENNWGLNDGLVIGVALDGLGFGTDNTIWGGEFFIADYCQFTRKGRLSLTPMAGGVQSVLEPWRNIVAHLDTHCSIKNLLTKYRHVPLFKHLQSKPVTSILKIIEKKINSPLSSSCGRLFDAVAASLDICFDKITYEGQAAIELENLVNLSDLNNCAPYTFDIQKESTNKNELLEIGLTKFWPQLIEDINSNIKPSQISASFHTGFSQAVINMIKKISYSSGLQTIVLTGGVFQNKLILNLCSSALRKEGFSVLAHQKIPSNDGGISLGQAVIAAANIKKENKLCV